MTEPVKAAKGLPQHKNAFKGQRPKQEESIRNLKDVTKRTVAPSAEVESLLSELVNTVGAVLTSRPTHVWQVYGGFQRIYDAIQRIFYHGCKHIDVRGNADLWPFVVGLRVLNPTLGPCVKMTTTPQPADEWIRMSLQNLQLAAKVKALTSDRDHVKKHFHPWALMRSQEHTSAIITCLRALEENSQSVLADINPKLLVGTYQPPPGTTYTAKTEPANSERLRTKPLLWDAKSSGVTSKFGFDKKSTSSLPTSPVTDKEWPAVWSHSSTQKGNLNREFLKDSLAPSSPSRLNAVESCKSKEMHSKVKGQSTVLSNEGKSKDSIDTTKPLKVNDLKTQDVTLMPRESPDGSSDSSDWPATSPVNQSPIFIANETSQVSSNAALTTISKLVHGKNIHVITNETGARPKEFSTTPKPIIQPVINKEFLDISDSCSGPGSSISPSLLQVNYGGEYSTSDGDSSSAYSIHRPKGCTGFRTPQLRSRASSGRLASVPADSDPDSEDTVDGNSQASRRRRRPPPLQQSSVKILVDSRGVLKSEGGNLQNNSSDCVRNISVSNSSSVDHLTNVVPVTSGLPLTSDFPVPSTTSDISGSNLPHVMSTPVVAKIPPEFMEDVALSAPERILKPNLLLTEAAKTNKKTHSRSRSDGSQELIGKLRLSQSNTAPELESKMKSGKLEVSQRVTGASAPIPVRKRFMEDGGHSITPAADYGFFPRPQPGQSLIGFLSSKEFHKQYADLDRENAHFNISEAVIAALTQMQFDSWQQNYCSSPGTADDSDEEIRNLQAQIREKRKQKLSGSVQSTSVSTTTVIESTSDPQTWACNSPVKLESTTDYSVYESTQSSPYNSESDLISEMEEEATGNDGSSSCEETPILRSRSTSNSGELSFKSDITSAENVALNLLKHFNERRLPKACELEWLVSEQDVPQKLLPLPTSVAISPDDGGATKESQLQTQLRGTSDWAPPRPQLILTLHANTKRSVLMGTQGWRCAGCGMRVSESLSRHFRLCNYLGRYFCTTCHSNQTAMIPAKILHKWDFKLCPVANFSSELIKSMRSDPLFNVDALNPGLYKRCRHLHQTYIYRLQLYHTLPYINTCSRAEKEKRMLSKAPPHWAAEPHAYSLDDLISVKAGLLMIEMKNIASQCIVHIAKCQVCVGRGFICEVCGEGEAIFPFQLDSTALCNTCSACFHAGCFSPLRCPRCIRRETRRLSQDHLDKPDS
ncbi:run domain Beclin-1-interacting and cysteine-rich domain-containing protein-like [Homarus americanus]|uniref:Run domain Beclin-1-interacting and cysteine-rich domain-containing protein-like n=1 Tax=Homarus americanus TaxID=6706 RepID=A0A8J5K4Q8_HOMAM|nr:run domain Beclin-1-interacting and cysteine-rich domain-containing protein-like [Homarus americanus]KAG7169257.1 Run domain Beclin-1-interacting and cysteine-rich domain-containing protein-like [Homarus americanus]